MIQDIYARPHEETSCALTLLPETVRWNRPNKQGKGAMQHHANGQPFASPRFLRRLLLLSAVSNKRGTSFAPSLILRHRIETSWPSNKVQRSIFLGASLSFDDGTGKGNNSNTNNAMSGGVERCSSNYNLAQDPSELFGIFLPPPSESYHNSVITADWGVSYFPSPLPTGEVKERNRVHKDGDWHRSTHAWVVQRDAQGDNSVSVLLQRRSPYKDTHPSLLDVSCAGHVNAGDDVFDTTMRELKEELGGNGAMHGYSLEEIRRGRAFTITSSIEGETKKFGRFICREFQDVFIIWLEGDIPIATNMFAPLVPEEVTGFEVLDGRELIARLREGDKDLVPRSAEYVDAFEKALFGWNAIVK
jgi:isopentenyldiphosphate isomerase